MYTLSVLSINWTKLIMRTTDHFPLIHSCHYHMFHTSCKPSHIFMYLTKCDEECSQCITWLNKEVHTKNCSAIEIESIASGTKANLNVKIQKDLVELQ